MGKVLEVNSIMSISIADVDRGKLHGTTAAAVVVEATLSHRRDIQRNEVQAEFQGRSIEDFARTPLHQGYSQCCSCFDGNRPHTSELANDAGGWRTCVGPSQVVGRSCIVCEGNKGDTSSKFTCFKAKRKDNTRCHKNNSQCRTKML